MAGVGTFISVGKSLDPPEQVVTIDLAQLESLSLDALECARREIARGGEDALARAFLLARVSELPHDGQLDMAVNSVFLGLPDGHERTRFAHVFDGDDILAAIIPTRAEHYFEAVLLQHIRDQLLKFAPREPIQVNPTGEQFGENSETR